MNQYQIIIILGVLVVYIVIKYLKKNQFHIKFVVMKIKIITFYLIKHIHYLL